jgi:hypothetical protein
MDTLFKSSANFASLSLKDLVEARDLFHYQLISKKNVVATALGLYRIRKSDPWPRGHQEPNARAPNAHKMRERRTLFNSEIRPYSWPCIYAFVSDWEYETTLSGTDPSDVVPRSLYLPDGRAVPVCVIETRRQEIATDLEVRLDGRTPRNLLGPGSAIVNNDGQGMARLATAGCIVRDGERFYVMTNRHAVGAAGTPIAALQNHRQPEIGVSAEKGLTRIDFKSVYPHFPSTNQHLLMDVGLIEVDDILDWKTEVPGIVPIGPVVDLYDHSLSLKLIRMKVVGLSAVSGHIRGEIHGLFYRYKSIGGSEYVSDFLIGPETHGDDAALEAKLQHERRHEEHNVSLAVRHGDSGTLLFIEHVERESRGRKAGQPHTVYHPFALLWGKEEFFEDGKAHAHPFALATSLSTALDRLNLDFVRDINVDADYIWGWLGHYAIGRALKLPTDILKGKLRSFIDNNMDLLSIEPDAALSNDPKVLTKGGKRPHFVPLADVPDNVWKSNVNFTMDHKQRRPGPGSRGHYDNKNHFADLDLPYRHGQTFLQLNQQDPDTYLNPAAWVEYFTAMEPQYAKWKKHLNPDQPANGDDSQGQANWGALPFRVHQLYDTMVKAAKAGNARLFLCAGGVLIHYVGDACQPLHASYLSQGDPAKVVKRPKGHGMMLQASGVHSGYEDDMIAYGYQKAQLAEKLAARIRKLQREEMPEIRSGYDASKAVIALICATQNDIAPRDIVDKWLALGAMSKKEKPVQLWTDFGDRTITCMARGTRYLAAMWQAAWDQGGGERTIGAGRKIKPHDIAKLYNDPDVLPSVALNQYPNDKDADWSKIKRPAPVKAGAPAVAAIRSMKSAGAAKRG